MGSEKREISKVPRAMSLCIYEAAIQIRDAQEKTLISSGRMRRRSSSGEQTRKRKPGKVPRSRYEPVEM